MTFLVQFNSIEKVLRHKILLLMSVHKKMNTFVK